MQKNHNLTFGPATPLPGVEPTGTGLVAVVYLMCFYLCNVFLKVEKMPID